VIVVHRPSWVLAHLLYVPISWYSPSSSKSTSQMLLAFLRHHFWEPRLSDAYRTALQTKTFSIRFLNSFDRVPLLLNASFAIAIRFWISFEHRPSSVTVAYFPSIGIPWLVLYFRVSHLDCQLYVTVFGDHHCRCLYFRYTKMAQR